MSAGNNHYCTFHFHIYYIRGWKMLKKGISFIGMVNYQILEYLTWENKKTLWTYIVCLFKKNPNFWYVLSSFIEINGSTHRQGIKYLTFYNTDISNFIHLGINCKNHLLTNCCIFFVVVCFFVFSFIIFKACEFKQYFHTYLFNCSNPLELDNICIFISHVSWGKLYCQYFELDCQQFHELVCKS